MGASTGMTSTVLPVNAVAATTGLAVVVILGLGATSLAS